MKMSKEEQIKHLIKSFNNQSTFEKQIEYLKVNNNFLELHLDNDGEYICFADQELNELSDEMYDYRNQFNNLHSINYIGNSDGAFKLLEILGVNVHYV
jgi:hypothetical protein